MASTVAEHILSYISEQGLAPGDKLPAEMEMSRILGFSRNSMREAYSDLIAKSVINRKHGVGTFVAEPPIYNSPGVTFGFWRMIEAAGMTPGLTELDRGRVTPDDTLIKRFEWDAPRPLGYLRWLFLANGKPCVLIDHYILPDVPMEAFTTDKVNNVLPPLQDHIQTEGATLETLNSAELAHPDIAEILQVDSGTAILKNLATIRSGDGSVALCSTGWMSPAMVVARSVTPLSPLDFVKAP
ncbi:GntR family transcriptional regulator [Pseudooceanicola sp. 200-1SW]|uniref:GntR family transcriptional regulator n=1 Tax=Pseudooceanicola sp. 200-1SW TaxID=3425949 RepID=UPI003D7F6B76